MSRHLLLFLAGTLAIAHTMFIDLGSYKLDEKKLETKTRYVYSDFNENKSAPLENATARYDIGLYQMNYENMTNSTGQYSDEYIRMYMIMTTSETLEKLTNIIEKNEDFLDKNNLTYSYLFKPMVPDFGFYKEIDLSSENNEKNRMNGPEVQGNDDGLSQFNKTDQLTFNHTEQILNEGVYYVSFLYEIIDQYKLEKEKLYESKNTDW